MKQTLYPTLEDLKMECVLMQAWKKTSAYLRYHSWYADTLGLDIEALRITEFIKQIQERLGNPEDFEPRQLKIVPAPKNQSWAYVNGEWSPQEINIDKKLRPLAHVDLQDQVIATAMMLCLADRVETRLGDPRLSIAKEQNRKRTLAYGHRLFCDGEGNVQLRHRWGSSKLYRNFSQDYKTFLERPKIVANELRTRSKNGESEFEIAIIQSDLSKFYDRVRPNLLHSKLRLLKRGEKEDSFFQLAERLLDWRWVDRARADRYAVEHEIPRFSEVALPQGLVASGFFANIALLDFDTVLRERIGKVIDENMSLTLHDACYYVDDFRMVLAFPKGSIQIEEEDVRHRVISILQDTLTSTAAGLEVSEKKTEVTIEGRDKRFLVKQSREAARIQKQVSGMFDMLHGTELIGAIEGFFHTQLRYSTSDNKKADGLLVGVPDMADGTAARFAAGKFRSTFRSLRPLLSDGIVPTKDQSEDQEDLEEATPRAGLALSKAQLDERGKFFSALLIEEWIRNPGNVRLLRIALDIYPDQEFLEEVLTLLRPGWKSTKFRKAKREVRLYCLSELFRAGATETGIVPLDELECLPSDVSIKVYHDCLIREAQEIFSAYASSGSSTSRFPWYLMQQVFLYLAARNRVPEAALLTKARGSAELRHYWQLLKFLGGVTPKDLNDRAIFLTEVSTAFGVHGFEYLSTTTRISSEFLARVNSISPRLAKELWAKFGFQSSGSAKQTAVRLGVVSSNMDPTKPALAHVASSVINPFIEEENLLQLAKYLLTQPATSFDKVVSPWRIRCALVDPKPSGYEFGKIDASVFVIEASGDFASDLFECPEWCETSEDRQRFNSGLLLRFALRGNTAFLDGNPERRMDGSPRYAKPCSHWEQQRYSGYQGRDTFGPAWIPISSFTENLLFELLRWPGSGVTIDTSPVAQLLDTVNVRLQGIINKRGQYTSSTFLEQSAPWPCKLPKIEDERPLRIGIVQSIIPSFEDYEKYKTEPRLNGPEIRTIRRAHLAAMMEGVSQMLNVRQTHRDLSRTDNRSIDLLVFPELAVHPDDVNLLILPFVRQHRCIVLCGQVYHPRDVALGAPLINSALWLVPEWHQSHGLQVKRIEQGKKHLTRDEQCLSPAPEGFRPVQWLIDYQWHTNSSVNRPLRLTASICYDATDIALAADLRSRSDLYIVCALNKDVGTFDRMTEALHYHMFQGVILVNNGQFSGSSFFMPFGNAYEREIFHLHGQPQASIAFAEVHPRKLVERPTQLLADDTIKIPKPDLFPCGKWKEPPADWRNPGGPI
jgi:hypothetical protein